MFRGIGKTVLFTALAAVAVCSAASAADVLPIKAKALQAAPCTIQSCSGWYAGVGLTGNGTNADVIGSGINQSVFAAGGIIDVHGGYQMWNGTYLFAAEVGLGNQFANGPINQFGPQSLIGYEFLKFGGALTQLFNQNPPAPGQTAGGVSLPSSIANALISPYVVIGALQRKGINEWVTGAGAEFALAQSWNLDLRYVYAPPQSGVTGMNLVTIGLNYHFATK